MAFHFDNLNSSLFSALCFLILIRFRHSFKIGFVAIISRAMHIILCLRSPIKHSETGRPLPTCPYQFPNGQGDIAKFLDGTINSDRWQRKHGNLYRIWSGTASEVVLTRPEHIQAVFRDSDKHSKAVNNNSGYLLSQILGQCVGLISRHEWSKVRAVTEKAFTRSASLEYVPLIQHRMKKYFNGLRSSANLTLGLLDPAEDLKMLPFFIVAEIIYGELSPDMETQLREIAPLRENLFKHVIRGGLARFSWSKYLPTETNRFLREFQTQWVSFNKKARQRAISQGLDAPIIPMYEAVENGTISEEQLYHTLDEILYANLDVTLGGISWNVVYLAASPSVQARLRHDLDEEGSPAHYLAKSSTFLAACVSESARLRPLAAFSVPQSVPTARLVDGYIFPAGTNFIVDSYSLNIRNPYWGDDSEVYRPERFIGLKGTDARYNYWRFGFGPRQCMGKHVADLIIRALLVHLVQHFELALLHQGEKDLWDRDRETWINHPRTLLKCKEKSVSAL